MAFTYSTRFAIGTSAAAGPTALYTVPAGSIAVIRDVSGLASAGPMGCAFAVNGAESFFSALSVPVLTSIHFEGRVVFNAGDVLDLFIFGGTLQYVVSGYLLTAP